jgi:hypothetical protein
MEKVIKDGKVGVLVSPGFGAGFLTWGAPEEAIFNPTLIGLVENEKWQEAIDFVEETWDSIYTGGVEDLVVAWIPEGTKFQITEYDGSESIELLEDVNWITA